MIEKTYRELMERNGPDAALVDAVAEKMRAEEFFIQSEKTDIRERPFRGRKTFWRAAVALAMAAVLSISGAAVSKLLSPAEATAITGNPLAQKAFNGKEAVIIDETQVMGDFSVTLLGYAPAEALRHFDGLVGDHTYAVLAVQRRDGSPMKFEQFFGSPAEGEEFHETTCLISGFDPEMVNSRSLGISGSGFLSDGVMYYVVDFLNLELFADHTIYLAVFEGHARYDYLTMDEDGSIRYRDNCQAPRVLFEVRLDESKADPEKAAELVDRIKMEWTMHNLETTLEQEQKAAQDRLAE